MRQANSSLFLNAELTKAERRAVQRRIAAGSLSRIAPGIAASLPEREWPNLLRREKVRVLAALFPGAIVGFKSAFDGMVGNEIYLSYTYTRTVLLPGLTIFLKKAPAATEDDSSMAQSTLLWPSTARMYLDNVTRSTSADSHASRAKIEERLLTLCEARGDGELQALRLQIETLAPKMNREPQARALSQIIGAILGTRPAAPLASEKVKGVALGYDATRVGLFDKITGVLRTTLPPRIPEAANTPDERKYFAFLESYFSNYIEGTEFELEEARDIAIEGKIIEKRPQDSHDIVGVFKQANDPLWRARALTNPGEFVDILQQRHREMLRMRPDAEPGDFKLQINRAGNTRFVEPRLVRGTLIEGAKRICDFEPGMAKAMLIHFVVSEVHPFVDGNGRLARIMMNAELSAGEQCRIIVPTLYREQYLDTLRLISRQENLPPFLKVMQHLQQWTSLFDYRNADALIAAVRSTNALEDSLNDHSLLMPA